MDSSQDGGCCRKGFGITPEKWSCDSFEERGFVTAVYFTDSGELSELRHEKKKKKKLLMIPPMTARFV